MKSTESKVDRFRKAITNNRFMMCEELEMLEILHEKYKLITVSEYARKENISQPAAFKRVNKNNKVPSIYLSGKLFVLDF